MLNYADVLRSGPSVGAHSGARRGNLGFYFAEWVSRKFICVHLRSWSRQILCVRRSVRLLEWMVSWLVNHNAPSSNGFVCPGTIDLERTHCIVSCCDERYLRTLDL